MSPWAGREIEEVAMRRIALVIVSVVILALSTGACVYQGGQPDTAQDERAIRALVQQEVDAANAGDAATLIALWTEDGIRMPPNGPPVAGKEALAAMYNAIFEAVTMDYAVVLEEVVVAGDWGFGRGTYTVTAVPKAGGEPTEDNGKFIDIYRRLPDGTWKYARHIWNSSQPLP